MTCKDCIHFRRTRKTPKLNNGICERQSNGQSFLLVCAEEERNCYLVKPKDNSWDEVSK